MQKWFRTKMSNLFLNFGPTKHTQEVKRKYAKKICGKLVLTAEHNIVAKCNGYHRNKYDIPSQGEEKN